MSEILKQHGKTILICIIGILIFGILSKLQVDGTTGFVNVVSQKAAKTMSSVDVMAYTDKDVVKAVLSEEKPMISYTYAEVVTETEINLENLFIATDAEGNSVTVEIIDILDETDNSVLYLTDDNRKSGVQTYSTTGFIFSSMGVYTIHVKAVDMENRTTYEQYQIPVL